MFPIQFCFPLPWHLPSGAALVHLQMIHLSFRSPPWAAGKLSHLEALSPWSPRCCTFTLPVANTGGAVPFLSVLPPFGGGWTQLLVLWVKAVEL